MSNPRIKDENEQWHFSEGTGEFVKTLQAKFPGIRITSGQREGEGSHHHTGDAVDIGVNRDTDVDALKMYTWLKNSQEGLQLMSDNGMGIIDETDPSKMSKYATGPHFHIGRDPHYVEEVNNRLGQFDSYYTYSGRDGAKYKKDTDGSWTIDTGKGYQIIDDPTGSRTSILNAQATINNVTPKEEFSFYSKNKDYKYGTTYNDDGGQTKADNSTTSDITTIPFEFVAGTPEFNFMQELNDVKLKQEEKDKKEEKSDSRKALKQKQEEKEFKEQQLIKAISSNKGYQGSPQKQRRQSPLTKFTSPQLQSQSELPTMPSMSEMPKFSDGGGVGDPPPTYADSLEAYNWGKSLNTGVKPYNENLIDGRFGIEDTPYRFEDFSESKIGDFLVRPVGYSNSDTHYPVYRKPKTISEGKTTSDPKMSVAVNLMKRGLDATFAARKQMAIDAGIKDYSGTATQNIQLNEYVFSNYDGAKKIENADTPIASPTVPSRTITTPVATPTPAVQQQSPIKLGSSTLQWVQNAAGTWHQVQRAATGPDFNLATGTIQN